MAGQAWADRQQIAPFGGRIAAFVFRFKLLDAAEHVGQAAHRPDGGVTNPGLQAGHGRLCGAEARGQFGLGHFQFLTLFNQLPDDLVLRFLLLVGGADLGIP